MRFLSKSGKISQLAGLENHSIDLFSETNSYLNTLNQNLFLCLHEMVHIKRLPIPTLRFEAD